jgi:hypothetical protein
MSSNSLELFSETTRSNFVSLDKQCKRELIDAFWPHIRTANRTPVLEEYTALFEFIGKTFHDLRRHASSFADQQLRDLLATLEAIQNNRAMTREQLVTAIKALHIHTNEQLICHSVELAARLWSGINIESSDSIVRNRAIRDSRINWPNDHCLKDAIEARFQECTTLPGKDYPMFDGSLTAASLKRKRGVKIVWTDNLAEHLKLHGQRKDRSLTVFRQKALLVNHQQAKDPVIPVKVIDEALHTLDILFPFGDNKTTSYLRSAGVDMHIAGGSKTQGSFAISEFLYWRSEMAQLVDLWNGPPETWFQALLEPGDGRQAVNLWVAIFGVLALTVLFGILATVYSIKQYQVAVRSYDLALALACLNNATLPGFCG